MAKQSPFAKLHALAAQRLNGNRSVTLQNSVGRRMVIETSERQLRLTITTKFSESLQVVDDYLFFRPKFSRLDSLIINISAEIPSGVGHVSVKLQPKKVLLEPDVIRGRKNANLRREWLPSIRPLESILSQRDYVPVPNAP